MSVFPRALTERHARLPTRHPLLPARPLAILVVLVSSSRRGTRAQRAGEMFVEIEFERDDDDDSEADTDDDKRAEGDAAAAPDSVA